MYIIVLITTKNVREAINIGEDARTVFSASRCFFPSMLMEWLWGRGFLSTRTMRSAYSVTVSASAAARNRARLLYRSALTRSWAM